MSDEIKIKYEQLQMELDKFNLAIKNFEPYSKNFVTKASKDLDGFNSDFILKIQGTLKSMTDTKAPALIKQLKAYSNNLSKLANEFREQDNELADSFKK